MRILGRDDVLGVLGPVLVAVVALGGLAVAGWTATGAGSSDVAIEIRYSAFRPTTVRVPAGLPVTFVLRNEDPIDHEWIVGDPALHGRHRTGREPVHAERPTEVTVPALETRRTTIVFDEPGSYQFICHLPGHEAYGMIGMLIVER